MRGGPLRPQRLHRGTETSSAQDIDGLLEQVEQEYTPDAATVDVHLNMGRLGYTAAVRAQCEKLLILFKDPIFNANSFTLPEDSITITPALRGRRGG